MQSRFFVALGLATVASGACATGTGSFEGGGRGSSSDTTTTSASSTSAGSGSATATGASASTSGAGGAGGAGGSGAGGGSMCAEDPCKLVAPQCGCEPDEQCSIDPSDGSRTCIAAGDAPWKALCPAGTQCEPGNICVNVTGLNLCGKLCDDDAQCGGPGGICLRTLNDANQDPIPDVTICTESCDPATSMGCPSVGTSCQFGREQMGQLRFFSICLASGAGMQGAACVGNENCAPTFGCFNDGVSDMCLKYCKVDAPNCPAGTQCVEITINMDPIIIGSEQYGACI